MRTREKILLLLLTATLALGAAVYIQSRNDETPLERFRWFLFHHPLRNISDALTSFTESSSENGKATIFGYGALSLLAVIIVGIVLKSAGNAELQAFRDRLVETQVAKAESEALLQDAMWKEKNARAAREAALKELQESSSRILALEDQLSGAEKLLKKREAELKALQSQQMAAPEPPLQRSLLSAPDPRALKEDLRKTTELLKSKESALAELEKTFAERIATLESQLKLSEKLRKEHDGELDTLRAEIARAQAAKHEAESWRAEQLNKEKQALAAKDAALKELEQNLTAKIRTLETQAGDHQELLQSRSTELEALKAEINVATARLANVAAAKEHADNLLQQELQQKAELLQSKDKAFKELQEASRASIQSLEARLADQNKLRQEHDQELAALRSQLTEAGAIKNRAETSLADELRKEKLAVAAKDAAMKELERQFLAKIDSLNLQLREKQESWQSCSTELEAFRSEINVLKARLADMASAKERVETLLQQELKNRAEALQAKDVSLKEIQTRLTAKARDLENQIAEKDAVLAQHHAELDALGAQLANVQSSGKQREELLRQELQQKAELLQAKDLATRELEDSLAKIAAAGKNEISERETLLKSREEELESLRSEVNALSAQLNKSDPATARPEGPPEEQTANEALKKLEESSKKILALEGSLREKEDLLKTHDGKIERLETELKEKRTELAKHEIAVWQAYERRALWKQRLAKFGISVKE
jgi:chromosome segregation ATPase